MDEYRKCLTVRDNPEWCAEHGVKPLVKPLWWWMGDARYTGRGEDTIEPEPAVETDNARIARLERIVTSLRGELNHAKNKLNEHTDNDKKLIPFNNKGIRGMSHKDDGKPWQV